MNHQPTIREIEPESTAETGSLVIECLYPHCHLRESIPWPAPYTEVEAFVQKVDAEKPECPLPA